MPQLFGRIVTVAVGQAGATGIALSGLRVGFRVAMSQSSSANQATIRIWNPNPLGSIALLEGPLPTVLLSVGYKDPLLPDAPGIPRLIFRGDVVKNGLTIRKEGPDRIVEIEAKDGGSAIKNTTVSLTFATPTTMSSVVSAIAAQMLLPVGFVSVVPDVLLSNGGVFHGRGAEILDDIAASTNSAWWVSDGVFYFAPTGAPIPPTGLVPQFSTILGNLIGNVKKKDRGGVEVRALLDADMRPGGSFVVVSPGTEGGTYVASDVVFEGDSGFDKPFYVTVTGRLPG